MRVAPLSAQVWSRSIAGAQPFGTDRFDALGDAALRADHRRERSRQLGDVVGEEEIGSRALTEPEVDRPRDTVVREEDVRQAQVAVRDPVRAHQLDLAPDRVEHVVGELVCA